MTDIVKRLRDGPDGLGHLCDDNLEAADEIERLRRACTSMREDCARAGNAVVELDIEIERLRSAIASAYGYLWCVNNEPDTPRQYPPERAAYAARKALRELLTPEQRGAAINEAVTKVHEAVRNDDLLGIPRWKG